MIKWSFLQKDWFAELLDALVFLPCAGLSNVKTGVKLCTPSPISPELLDDVWKTGIGSFLTALWGSWCQLRQYRPADGRPAAAILMRTVYGDGL